jgi:hypothetical protein
MASSMPRRRERESLGNRDRLRKNTLSKSGLEAVLRHEIDTATEERLEVLLQPDEREQPDGTSELHQQVDVARSCRLIPSHRAKKRQGLHTTRVQLVLMPSFICERLRSHRTCEAIAAATPISLRLFPAPRVASNHSPPGIPSPSQSRSFVRPLSHDTDTAGASDHSSRATCCQFDEDVAIWES